MKAIVVMFDSLNRAMLPPYGCQWTHAPNFKRLAERTVTFERSYVCSMPCMPARRDWHTGRPNFLHRGWGPLEPFDDSVPEILRTNDVHTHLSTDHYHYFEDGGATYHTKYKTWEFFRGQEGDAWIGQVKPVEAANACGRHTASRWHNQDQINRQFMREEHLQPQSGTFRSGLDFIRRNADADRWCLHIETFDPHEPFFSHGTYKDHFAEHYAQWRAAGGPQWDWPPYQPVTEPPEYVEHMRYEYASLLAMCDAKLGDVLDLMDELSLWDDTMLIVWTDHGFLLGEHECWAKCWMPFYEEIAHTPFFVWDPRSRNAGERRASLVQPSIDLGPTLLDFFGVGPTSNMTGHSLGEAIAGDAPVREAAIFGIFGGHVNVTDGRFVYMRGPTNAANGPLNEYTLMPSRMKRMMRPSELRDNVDLAEPFRFTKGCSSMRISIDRLMPEDEDVRASYPTLLFDIQDDPQQLRPLDDPSREQQMLVHLVREMRHVDAPQDQFARLGIDTAPQ